jgi:hypothetical protein
VVTVLTGSVLMTCDLSPGKSSHSPSALKPNAVAVDGLIVFVLQFFDFLSDTAEAYFFPFLIF